jgi:hypothetical protein
MFGLVGKISGHGTKTRELKFGGGTVPVMLERYERRCGTQFRDR